MNTCAAAPIRQPLQQRTRVWQEDVSRPASLHCSPLQDSGCFQYGLHAGSAAVVIDDISDLVVGCDGVYIQERACRPAASATRPQKRQELESSLTSTPRRSFTVRAKSSWQSALSSVRDGTRLQSAAAPGTEAACKRQTSAGPASAFHRAKAAEASRLATSLWRSSSPSRGCSVAGMP